MTKKRWMKEYPLIEHMLNTTYALFLQTKHKIWKFQIIAVVW